MYKFGKANKTFMVNSEIKEGETIEEKVRRLIENKEPIKDGAPILLQRKEQRKRQKACTEDSELRRKPWWNPAVERGPPERGGYSYGM